MAASQIYKTDTDVLLLTTNQIKKDIGSQNQYEIGIALCGLAKFMSNDLARDLANDIITLTTSTRPYVRKLATLITYKVFLNFPDALRPTFQRLKEKLDDNDPSVQSCAVNVICELARKNPQNYLSLAPIFFKLLTASSNNWMRIKIIKLFAALCPLEPRLAKKLIEPLTSLIHQTPAMSLLYECINTVIISVPDHLPSIQLCVTKLRIFVEDQDQNLKYLGLQSMARVLKIAPKAVAAHRDLIIGCLDDEDESIRLRALALIGGMVSKKNLMEIVKKLMEHIESVDGTGYRDTVIAKIIDVCSHENYKYITDFGWYLEVLIKLTFVEGTRHGKMIGAQLMDVSIRVKVVRAAAAKQLVKLLGSESHLLTMGNQKNGVCEVLYAAAYVSGEFAELVESPEDVMESLLLPHATSLPGHIQAVFVQNAVKLYSHISSKVAVDDEAGQEKLAAVRAKMMENLQTFMESQDLEVQERAVGAHALIKYVNKQRGKGVNIDNEVAGLFEGDLNPVAAKAQRKVPVPEGLDLDKWINPPPKEDAVDVSEDLFNWMDTVSVDESLFKAESDDEDTKAAKRAQRKTDNEANPFHLGGGAMKAKKKSSLIELSDGDAGAAAAADVDVDDIPVKKLDLGIGSIFVDGLKKKKKKKKLTKKQIKKLKKKGLPIPVESEDDEPMVIEIAAVEEMPEGAEVSDGDDGDDEKDAIYKALNINLDDIGQGDVLASAQHHVAKDLSAEEAAKLEKEKAKKAKKDKKKAKKDKKDKKKGKKGDGEGEGDEGEADAGADAAAEDAPAAAEDAAAEEPAAPAAEEEPAAEKAAPAAGEEKKEKKKKDKKDKKKKKKSKKALATSAPRPLASNDALAVTVETEASADAGGKVSVTFAFTNTSDAVVTVNAVSFEAGDAAKVVGEIDTAFDIEAGKANSTVFTLDVSSTGAEVAAKGAITYKAGDAEASLDFELPLLDSTLIYAKECGADEFAGFLGGGKLSAKASAKVPTAGAEFKECLAKLCSTLHLHVVESMDGAASLYGLTTAGTHLCFLIKAAGEEVALSAKSSDEAVLTAIMAEAKSAFSTESTA